MRADFEVTAAQMARAHWFTVDDLLKRHEYFYLEMHGRCLWLVNYRDGYTWRIMPNGSAEKFSVGTLSNDGHSMNYYPLGDRQPALVFPPKEKPRDCPFCGDFHEGSCAYR